MNKVEEEEAPVQPHFDDDDEDNEEEEEDESGEDLMKGSGNVVGSEDDSSEESEDDPEEAKRIAEGFIVDEDEVDGGSDEESRRRRKKARKRRKRLEAEAESDEALDEDDLDLLAENTGVRRKQRQLKRFRRASASPPAAGQAEASARKPRDLQHMFDDDDEDAPVASRRAGRRGDDDDDDDDDDDLPAVGDALRANANQRGQAVPFNYEDEMEDFIDDDDESEMDEAMSEGEREQRREERRQQRKTELEERRKRRNGLGFDPSRAGIDAEAWAELNEVFGDGTDYLKYLDLEDSEEEGAEGEHAEERRQRKEDKVKTMAQIFEPSAMEARMMTTDDERIKKEDFPERFQMMLPGDEGVSLLARELSSEELDECTRWVSTRFTYRSSMFLSDAGKHSMFRDFWFKCLRTMCELIINERREPMFLVVNRLDDYEYRVPGGNEVIDFLQRREFFSLAAYCLKFKTLLARRDSLREALARVLEDGEGASLDLTTTFEQLLQRTESTDEVTDVSDWLIMHFGQRMRDAQAQRDSSFKRPTVMSQYEQLKGTTVASLAARFGITATQLAENVAGQSKAHFTDDDEAAPLTVADEYVGDGTTATSGPPSASMALESSRKLLAHEIGRDPTIKRETRRLLRESGLINVKPTDQGHYKIDDEHPYYNFKFLERKPVSEFISTEVAEKLPGQAQFLMMLRAEEELLVEISVNVREIDARAFETRLIDNFISEGFSETSRLWNTERRQIIRQALEEHLYPAAKLWVREWLREECWEYIGRLCEVALTNRIERQPYESTTMRAVKQLRAQPYGAEVDDDDEQDQLAKNCKNVPKVLAISHGKGDNRRDEIETIYLDVAGRMREHLAFESIEKPAEDPNEMQVDGEQEQADKRPDPSREFVLLLQRRRPDVIVIGGFSPRTVALRQQVQKLVKELVDEVKTSLGDAATQAQLDAATIDVIHCQDDVARLFQHSSRAKEEYPSLSVLARYCVGLARYVQSPVQEFAALNEDDLRAVRYDGHQDLIPPERLQQSLERALVAVVNTVCVNLQRCGMQKYYANMLQYVSGLGRRKKDALQSAIQDQLDGRVVNREALLLGKQSEESILGPHVWMNACSFLYIPTDVPDSKKSRRNAEVLGASDALDSTRIHPEIYDKARFIAGDALQKTEEDQVEGQHESAWVAELLQDEDRRAKVENIDMEDYERQLMLDAANHSLPRQRWLFRLEAVARELVEPLWEQRLPFALPSADEIVTMLTGETRATFDTQHLVTVTVRQTTRDYAIVQLESGIEGTIHQEYLLPKDSAEYSSRSEVPYVRDLVKHGQTLKALIIDVDLDNVRVELTARPAHIETAKPADAQRRKVEVDARYFDREQAELERTEAELTRQRKQNANRSTRLIRHPDFHNFKAGQAEEFLANGPRGSAVVRPSSKGDDHLAVTWKVDEGVYQHFDVLELDKDPRQEIGRILRVANMGGSSYSDIDELLVNHVAPMARMVEMLMAHEKYHGSEEELQRFLSTFSLANPNRSQYGFAIDRKRPGLFVLGFKANRDAQILRWVVRVLPGRFKLNEAELPDVVSLCNAFKTQYTTRAMRSGGAGAMAGGRTPAAALAGGMTPGVMRSGLGGGMTPRVGGGYGGGGASVRAARPIGGATPYGATPMVGLSSYAGGLSAQTPNPYAYGGGGARPPPPGAPPMRPGPPPARPPQMGAYGAAGPAPAAPGAPPSRAAAGGIHPDRLAQMGAGGALPGSSNGYGDPRDYNSGGW